MAVEFGYEGLIPYMKFDGASYYTPPDTPGIVTGTESWVTSTQRGITVGCWAKFDNTGDTEGVITKWLTTDNQRSYQIRKYNNETVRFRISDDGSLSADEAISSGTIDDDIWYFLVGRWNSSMVSIFIDNVKTEQASTYASIYNGAGTFMFGNVDGGGIPMTGYIAFPFICAASLSDAIIENIWNKTKSLFGK